MSSSLDYNLQVYQSNICHLYHYLVSHWWILLQTISKIWILELSIIIIMYKVNVARFALYISNQTMELTNGICDSLPMFLLHYS